jgi:penicillin amidase
MLRSFLRLALGTRLPVVRGTVRVRGLGSSVTIRRDDHGIPYVEASSDADAFFGLGFAQVQDRQFQIELYLRVARGTLAEILGPEMLPVDRLSRRIGFRHIAERQLAKLAPRERAQLESFVRGVNAGHVHGLKNRSHELALLGADASPLEATDIIAVLQFFAFALSSNWDAELARFRVLRADGAEALHALEASRGGWEPGRNDGRMLFDDAALGVAVRLANEVGKLGEVTGLGGASNAWALAPSRTATGRPILACDPHLAPSLPAPWYLMHVRTPEWAMSGAFLPGNPIPTFGHNEHVAWGIAAGHVDNTDRFIEQLGPSGTSVREGAMLRACDVRTEVIRVKGEADVTEKVLITRRGPIVSPALGDSDVALSMCATWMAPRKIGGYDIYRARNVDEASALYASYPALSESRVFADTAGTISWHIVGDAPIRRKGEGMLPAPGWDPDYGWHDEPLPYEALPNASAPPEGLLVAANQDPGPSPLGAFLGADWLDGSRHAHLVEMLSARSDWDVPSTARLQTNRKTVLWPRIREAVLGALRGAAGANRRALHWLESWDGVVGPESSAASIFEVFFAEMVVRIAKSKAPRSWRAVIGEGTNAVLPHGAMALRRLDHAARLLVEQPPGFFARGWQEEIVDAVDAAVKRLKGAVGGNDTRWAWGRARPVFLVHPVGTKAPLDRIWNRGPLAWGGDATTIPQGSVAFDAPLGNAVGLPNLRAVIDVGNWEESRYVLAGGQSGNPLSRHYDDMIDAWLRGESVSMAWHPETVRMRTHDTLHLEPEAAAAR